MKLKAGKHLPKTLVNTVAERQMRGCVTLEVDDIRIRKDAFIPIDRGQQKETEELLLRHVGFIIFRIHKKTFPAYVNRFGEDIFSQAVYLLCL